MTKGKKPKATAAGKKGSVEPKKPVRIVAIGASAGGLEPLEVFFGNMQENSGLAFVVIQHLSPDFRSMMDELLARKSSMKIEQAKHGQVIEADTIYLGPSRSRLAVTNGRFVVEENSTSSSIQFPIDFFFKSLAADQKQDSIGIILSGTGSDGTNGCGAIFDFGGTVIAQDIVSAKFDSMPKSVFDNNYATAVANPAKMPELLERVIDDLTISDYDENEITSPENAIITQLKKRFGADFREYKESTVRRRIQRRASLNRYESLEKYADRIAESDEELEILYHDLLIGVTSFFRDAAAFEYLEHEVVPEMIQEMSDAKQIRIWVPGCATGQEAYSIAMMFADAAAKAGVALNLKIFATDLHNNSLDFAKNGIYTGEEVQNIPEHYLDKYFNSIAHQYHVHPFIKKTVVFSQHNLLKDPPFTKIDLVSCRNVMIYFNEAVQQKVLALFHFALAKMGVLFLGSSENLGSLDVEFTTLNKRWKLYSKKRDVKLFDGYPITNINRVPVKPDADSISAADDLTGYSESRSATSNRLLLQRAYDEVLSRFVATAFLVDSSGALVHVFGEGEKYLKISKGTFSRRLPDMIHPEIRLTVSAGLEAVIGKKVQQFKRSTTISNEVSDSTLVTMTIESFEIQDVSFYLVVLEEAPEISLKLSEDSNAEFSDSEFFTERIKQLEERLQETQESLQTTIEELETSNEELQATNEELMASNEELQSTNEELHSVNEELYTVSSEHQRKIEELTDLTEDMDNLLKATNIGTVFLDEQLNIKRFTPAASQLFNLIPHDIGRPFGHITYRFDLGDLYDQIVEAADSSRNIEHKVWVDDQPFLLRVQNYTDKQDNSGGIVIVAIDVNGLEEAVNLQ
jgi:two-component system CheB/CheR fusion protein